MFHFFLILNRIPFSENATFYVFGPQFMDVWVLASLGHQKHCCFKRWRTCLCGRVCGFSWVDTQSWGGQGVYLGRYPGVERAGCVLSACFLFKQPPNRFPKRWHHCRAWPPSFSPTAGAPVCQEAALAGCDAAWYSFCRNPGFSHEASRLVQICR